jgi:hypothetical protein
MVILLQDGSGGTTHLLQAPPLKRRFRCVAGVLGWCFAGGDWVKLLICSRRYVSNILENDNFGGFVR